MLSRSGAGEIWGFTLKGRDRPQGSEDYSFGGSGACGPDMVLWAQLDGKGALFTEDTLISSRQ